MDAGLGTQQGRTNDREGIGVRSFMKKGRIHKLKCNLKLFVRKLSHSDQLDWVSWAVYVLQFTLYFIGLAPHRENYEYVLIIAKVLFTAD